jgi:hypothetical protein
MTLEDYCEVLAKRHEFTWRFENLKGKGGYVMLHIVTRQQIRYASPKVEIPAEDYFLRFWLLGILQGEMHQRSCDKIVRRKELL